MIKVKYPVIVEGKYDKIKLSSIIDTVIKTTNGFGIFKDKSKAELIKKLAENGKIIILTDSDKAGRIIRGHLKGIISPEKIINLYTPDIFGKEKRKSAPSAEGKLGVEGIDSALIKKIFRDAGLCEGDSAADYDPITKALLFELSLTGAPNSTELRRKVQRSFGLPDGISPNALCEILTRITTPTELRRITEKIKREGDLK